MLRRNAIKNDEWCALTPHFHPPDLLNQQKTDDQLNYYDLPKTSPIHFVRSTYCANECTLKQGGTTAPRWQWCHYKSQISPKKAKILNHHCKRPKSENYKMTIRIFPETVAEVPLQEPNVPKRNFKITTVTLS
jgi:hypothetical protein